MRLECECAFWATLVSHPIIWLVNWIDGVWLLGGRCSGRSPCLIFQVVGQSRDDVPTVVHRREAIIPARSFANRNRQLRLR